MQLVSTTNTTLAIGATFTAYLLGAIFGTFFNSELKYATTGNVVHHQAVYTSVGNSTAVAVPVVIESTIGPFSPATMLDHVRNSCGSLLYSISVKAIYAPRATVQFADPAVHLRRVLVQWFGPRERTLGHGRAIYDDLRDQSRHRVRRDLRELVLHPRPLPQDDHARLEHGHSECFRHPYRTLHRKHSAFWSA